MVSSVSLTALILFLKQRPLLNLKIMTGRMERFLKPISYRFSTIWQSQVFRKRILRFWSAEINSIGRKYTGMSNLSRCW